MPANLPPQYFETEKKLKTAKSYEEKILILEELLSIVPKHKGTEKLQALLKTKIAKLKSQTKIKSYIAKHRYGFHLEKAGAGQIVLIGPPNSGKSSLLKSLTNANPEIGVYPFTTHTPCPGMMHYENIQIQLIDTPPITVDYMENWHTELIKYSDAILILLDLANSKAFADYNTLLVRLKEKRIKTISHEGESSSDEYSFYKKALIVANKNDIPDIDEVFASLKRSIPDEFQPISISALQGNNLENLKKKIFYALDIVRVYSKTPGKKANLTEPFVLKKGSILMDMAIIVHKDFAKNLKFARIWGKNKYQGQKVDRHYMLHDEDIIELHI